MTSGSVLRLRFPDDEGRLPWLPLLLDAYAVIDEGIAKAIAEAEKKKGLVLACGKGCGNCCSTHRDIPVYPLELVGIYWFVIEKLTQPLRAAVKGSLLGHRRGGPCPFLIEGACAIHPMRPAACRQFNVFGKQCEEGEDAYYTRRSDVLTPRREFADRAFSIMLPFYGVTGKKEMERAVKTRMIDNLARALQLCNWQELPVRMEEFDISRR
ncbi:MAG TPA: YkgJ family cysteine cluster protein [Dissulfurispiraceae bacterium]|nr:YkgJ family cysteine cluster protein [Dissulfurispiraceae bacterium]